MTWYEAHAHLFTDVEHADVVWARLHDGDLAARLLDEAQGLDGAGFLDLVSRHRAGGLADSGRAELDHLGNGADVSVGRVAFAVREAGGLGLLDDGTDWWLVLVEDVTLEEPAWDAALGDRVRTAMMSERERSHLATLAADLQRRWPVERVGGESAEG